MGPPSISSMTQYPHHASSIPNDYQMMNGYDFLNSTTHHQSSFPTTGFQHSPFSSSGGQGQPFNSNHVHFNQGKLNFPLCPVLFFYSSTYFNNFKFLIN
jgi:hypothetical protein